MYDIEIPDQNIDFRRVKNLYVFFNLNAESLTTDISKISEWQGKPNLNVLFNYNMPIRGYAKMTGGFVTMEMAEALTEMANGHRIKGTAHLIKAAVKRD